jgi:hypothetical protein
MQRQSVVFVWWKSRLINNYLNAHTHFIKIVLRIGWKRVKNALYAGQKCETHIWIVFFIILS